jgi:uncharacterized protein (DUF362 family)
MSLNRRQFLKNTSIGTAALIGGAGLLKKSAFAEYPRPAPSQVYFVGSSSSSTRQAMITSILAPFQPLITNAINAGKTIILKPNCVGTGTKDTLQASNGSTYYLAMTHPDTLAAIILFIRNTIGSNVPIYIAEAAAGTTSTNMNSQGYCTYFVGSSTYTNVTLVDLTNNVVVGANGTTGAASIFPPAIRHLWKPNLSQTVAIYGTSAFLNPNNFIISVCRPKAHNNMVVTGTTKNMCMGFPLNLAPPVPDWGAANANVTSCKQAMHDGSPTGTRAGEDKVLAYNIFQNASHFVPLGHPDLAILDAWEGMQGAGPESGTSVQQYCAVASEDNLAVDRIGAKLMGLTDTENLPPITPPDSTATINSRSYSDPRYLLWQSNAGYGNYNLNNINLNVLSLPTGVSTWTSYIYRYAMHANYDTTPSGSYTSYPEIAWQGSDTLGPAGNDTTSGPHSTVLDQLAAKDSLYMDPKPFMMPQTEVVSGSEVKIEVSMPAGYPIQLGIYNMQDQKVRSLASEFLPSGRYSMVWDCKTDGGSVVSNGCYVIKFQFGSRTMADRITVMR